MLSATDPREEERAARAALRNVQRAQRAAAQSRQREWSRRLREVLAATPRRSCRCGLRAGMSRDDLRALGAGCTDPWFVCPRLDAVRRRLGL